MVKIRIIVKRRPSAKGGDENHTAPDASRSRLPLIFGVALGLIALAAAAYFFMGWTRRGEQSNTDMVAGLGPTMNPGELPPLVLPSLSGFQPLFTGDLTGWKPHLPQSQGWSVENGLLTGRADQGDTYLFSERGDFANFHLRAEVKISDGGNSGIYFRTPFAQPQNGRLPGGYEAQILHRSPNLDAYLTGSLTNLVKAPSYPWTSEEWFPMEIIAEDNVFTIRVKDFETAKYTAESKKGMKKKGYIALQAMQPKSTVVQFRKIEIKELP